MVSGSNQFPFPAPGEPIPAHGRDIAPVVAGHRVLARDGLQRLEPVGGFPLEVLQQEGNHRFAEEDDFPASARVTNLIDGTASLSPFISVVIPTYNRSDLLVKAVRSVRV